VQNFASGGFSAPQEEHRAPSLAPHSAQNLALAAFSVLHFGQTIRFAVLPKTRA
jgi:hypothetical protein